MRNDGTVRLLKKFGIAVTRENYLQLAFAGNPPEELDGEIEEELPKLPSRNRTRLPLTKADRHWLREIGIGK